MRKIGLLLLGLLFVVVACRKKDLGISFRMNFKDELIIHSSVGVNLPVTIQSPPTTTNSQATFSGENTSAERVSSINLEEMTLTLTQPSSGDFSFLESIYILLSSEGLADDTIAWLNPVTGNSDQLQLNTTSSNLKPYLIKEEYQLKAITKTDELISQEHRILIESSFRVEAELFD